MQSPCVLSGSIQVVTLCLFIFFVPRERWPWLGIWSDDKTTRFLNWSVIFICVCALCIPTICHWVQCVPAAQIYIRQTNKPIGHSPLLHISKCIDRWINTPICFQLCSLSFPVESTMQAQVRAISWILVMYSPVPSSLPSWVPDGVQWAGNSAISLIWWCWFIQHQPQMHILTTIKHSPMK